MTHFLGLPPHHQIILAIVFVVLCLYCLTLFLFLQKFPVENRKVPNWLVWFFLIPIVSIVFQWIMLPFAIPNLIGKTYAKNQAMMLYANTLMKLGLAQVILVTVGLFIQVEPVRGLIALCGIIVGIIYWVKIARFQGFPGRTDKSGQF